MSLPRDSKERKKFPMYEGLLKYFPDALAAVSHLSWEGNEQHNPGEPLHWAKGKSTDHADCILRHLVDALKAEEGGDVMTQEKELTAVAWRALARLQTFYDSRAGNAAGEAGFVGTAGSARYVGYVGGDVAGPQVQRTDYEGAKEWLDDLRKSQCSFVIRPGSTDRT